MARAIESALALITEAQAQQQILDGLAAKGYLVRVTSLRNFTGNASGKGPGTDEGIPDLLITHSKYPKHVWLGIEVKKPVGWKYSSVEQRQLCESGRNAVATSFDEAWSCLMAFERLLGSGATA